MSTNTYQLVTDIILKKLAQGVVPWKRPWSGAMPQNIRGNEYRGINNLLLGMEPYKSPFWLTYRQATERGGYIRKGEKSHIALFWKLTQVKDNDPENESGTKTIPFMRLYKVFNLEQTENVKLEPKLLKAIEQMETNTASFDPIAKADAIWQAYQNRPALVHGNTGALYRLSTDTIYMPHKYAFNDAISYHSCLTHEAIHSTAHRTRLDRKLSGHFGSKEYALEELIAELGSAFLLAKAGLDPVPLADQQAAYIQSWSQKLKNDPKLFVTAAGKAQRAADYVLNLSETEEEEPAGEMAA